MAKACPRCSAIFPDEATFCPFDGAALAKAVDKLIGRTIAARYRLTKRLGAGGMSVVYLATHELISRQNAIKVLRPELSRIPEHRERFLREARAVNRINHPNVVEITDVGESDGVAYLVMEYIDGESLLAQIQRGPLRWERAARIAMQVASALARTHQASIIHRDLKPENILLVEREGKEHVKLTDFGIAKMMSEPTLTLNEQLFGTPGYIAPEYVAGLAIDGRADLYSLAVVLYEMLTTRLPFEGTGQSDLLLKPLSSAPIPPSERVAGLPPDLESLILRCLAREPNDRPHDAFALHDALADILRRLGTEEGARSGASGGYVAAAKVRDPLETVIDRVSATELAAAPSPGRVLTGEMSARWTTALAELEGHIARARRAGGASSAAAARAVELALVAGEMVPRIDRAKKAVADLQAKVDRLESEGREFRSNLGHAIDVLVHDRSRERAHIDELRARREAVQRVIDGATSVEVPHSDPRPWEVEALADEETRAEGVVSDLSFQIEELQGQLDHRNASHERELVRATGGLEGSLAALRRLANELARTIEEATALVKQAG